MSLHRRHLPLALVLVPLLANLPVRAADVKGDQEPTKFLRFVEEGRDGGRLETGIATYKNPQGVTVQLVGAVHIADTGYYEALNKQFEGYDALLYEMVKPKDMGAPGRDREQANGISLVHILQKGMKTFLDLDYQLDGIDYTRKNFVHADLTAEEFNRMQDERGESIMGLMLQQMLREMMKGDFAKQQQDFDPMQLISALTSDDGPRQIKVLLAKQFENMDDMVAGLEGPDGSVLLTERNKACIKVLNDTLADGKKNIGVFYGAAHMKDMEKRLTEMGFKRTAVEWRVAWDLAPNKAAAAAQPRGKGRGGEAVKDDRDEQIKKLLDRIEQLEKRLDEKEKAK